MGVAVNVTLVPEQIAPEGLAVILTEGVNVGFTTIVIVFDVAVIGLAQLALDVIIQSIVFPFARLPLVYEGWLLPTFEPFNCH